MSRLLWALALLGVACSTSGGAVRTGSGEAPRAPSASEFAPVSAALYATDPPAGGGDEGPRSRELARAVEGVLRARGDVAREDPTLARLADWYHAEAVAHRNPNSPQAEGMAARLGFLGALHAASVFSLEGELAAGPWRDVLAQLARNAVVNRFGVWTSADGTVGAVVFAAVELTLTAFPRHFSRGQTLMLRGQLGPRFPRGDVFLTPPTGTVEHSELGGRRIDVGLRFPAAGIYRVEVMGDGPSGPVVLANVPVYVDAVEPEASRASAGAPLGSADAAERMLTLLNQARRDAHLAPLAADPELQAVALAYSQEMVTGHFFGHVSPTTGNVADRVQRAGIGLTIVGENISQGESAESAHQGLMDSPGHRSNMLDPRFTHVGVGVAATNAEPQLLATLVFARRPDPSRLTAPQVVERIAVLRRGKRVPPVLVDPVLQKAAAAGVEAFANRSAPSKDMAVTEGRLRQEDRRLGLARGAGCAEWLEILELDDLRDVPLLVSPTLNKLGLAVTLKPSGRPAPLIVLILVEGSCR